MTRPPAKIPSFGGGSLGRRQQQQQQRALPRECGTCRFYATGNGHADQTGMGVCRRFPPQGIEHRSGGESEDTTVMLLGAWPHIAAEEICGEWQMKEKR